MAIDYSGYAQNYAGYSPQAERGAAQIAQAAGQALGSIPNFRQRFANFATEKLKSELNPLTEAALGDIRDFDLNKIDFKSAGSLYKEYMDASENAADVSKFITGGEKGKFFGKRAIRKNLVKPLDFINAYRQGVSSVAGQIGQKLINYKNSDANISDSDMRKFIKDRGLNNFILENFTDMTNENHSQLRAWAQRQQTLGDKVGNLGGYIPKALGGSNVLFDPDERLQKRDIATVAIPAAPALYYGGKALNTGLKAGSTALADRMIKTPAEKLLGPQSRMSQDILERAKGNYESMKKVHGGPGVNNPQGKRLKSKFKMLEKRVASQLKNEVDLKDVKNIWGQLMQKYGGKRGLTKAVFSKLGKRRGALMLARLGAGGLLTGTGLGTAVGVAMTGSTLYTLYNVARELLAE